MLQPPHEHLHVILLDVLRRVDKRDIVLFEFFVQLPDERFRIVARFEFFEVRGGEAFERHTARVVKLAELGGRRDLFRPGCKVGTIFLHAARPEAVDEDALAVRFFCRFIDAFCLQCSHGTFASFIHKWFRPLLGRGNIPSSIVTMRIHLREFVRARFDGL